MNVASRTPDISHPCRSPLRTLLPTVVATVGLALTLQPVLAQDVALQGGTNTDGSHTISYYDEPHEKLEISRIITGSGFQASEIGNYVVSGVEGPDGIAQVREVCQAMRTRATEDGGEYYGFFSFPNLPGLQPEELGDLAAHRAMALDSRGRTRVVQDGDYPIAFTGEAFDITRREAVELLLERIGVVFDWEGGRTESVGPLYGYYMLSEDSLTSRTDMDRVGVVLNDDSPCFPALPGCTPTNGSCECNPCRCQKMGNPNPKPHYELYGDFEPYYSFLRGIKRDVPLFTPSARDSFVQYAASKGHPGIQRLPVDRAELNDCGSGDGCLQLAGHTQIVPLTLPPSVTPAQQIATYGAPVTTYWTLWREWAFKTWSELIEEVARAVTLAQLGNPDFKGVIAFEPPMSYTLLNETRPVSYSYYNASGQRVDVPNYSLQSWGHYQSALANEIQGNDMNYLLKSPWIVGLIHETASGTVFTQDAWDTDAGFVAEPKILASEWFQNMHLAQGVAAQRIAQEQGKVFGIFFRTLLMHQGVSDPRMFMSPTEFSRAFDALVGESTDTADPTARFLRPAILFTIDGSHLIQTGLGDWPLPCGSGDNACGDLVNVFSTKTAAYRNSAPFMITDVPMPQIAAENSLVVLTGLAAGGVGSKTYRWQRSTNGGVTFPSIPSTDTRFTGAASSKLRILSVSPAVAGLYRLRVDNPGGPTPTLFTRAVPVDVVLANDDFAPGSGALGGRATPIGALTWASSAGAAVFEGGIEPTTNSAVGTVPVDAARLNAGETFSVRARVRVQAGLPKWGAIGFAGAPTSAFNSPNNNLSARLWMNVQYNGRVHVRADGVAVPPLVNVPLPNFKPGAFADLELQYRRVGGPTGQHQGRALANGVEIMPWRDVTFPGSILYVGFHLNSGIVDGNPALYSRVDDFSVRSLGVLP